MITMNGYDVLAVETERLAQLFLGAAELDDPEPPYTAVKDALFLAAGRELSELARTLRELSEAQTEREIEEVADVTRTLRELAEAGRLKPGATALCSIAQPHVSHLFTANTVDGPRPARCPGKQPGLDTLHYRQH